jgi:hypothetical protein
MSNSRKRNAHGKVGANVTELGGGVTGQKKVFRCGSHHTSQIRRELQACGLALRNASGQTQRQTLLRVLEYLGDRGINTPEGVACGFYRIATRIQELEAEGWLITSRRERMLGADGLIHIGIARYILRGRSADFVEPQGALDLGGAQ